MGTSMTPASSVTPDQFALDDGQSQCFHSVRGANSTNGQNRTVLGVRFPNRKLDGSPDVQPRLSPDGVIHTRREHLNVVAVEGPLPNGTLLTVQHFHVVGSPAMF